LCLRSGVLNRHLVVRDAAGNETEVNSRRFASFVNPNYAAIRYAWKPLNYNAKVEFKTGLEGRLKNTGVDRYNSLN
jgi:alpha,alpha-trehalase